MDLIGVNKLREFFETVILTGRLKDTEPVSAMIIADPERGKTSVVLEKNCDAFKVLTDLTGKGLQFLCQMDARCTHFILNDMGVIAAHSQKTCDFFFAMLIAMTEEGIRSVATPKGFESIASGRRGFIGCITSNQAKDHRSWWYRRGLARRMVPFHFDYRQELILNIKAEIDKNHYASFKANGVFKVPEAHIDVDVPAAETKEIRRISDSRAEKLEQLGISLLKNYRSLAKAHAIGRTWQKPSVNEQDIEFLKRIDPYVDWKIPAIL